MITKIPRESNIINCKLLVSVSQSKEESLGGPWQWLGLCGQRTVAPVGFSHRFEYRLQHMHQPAAPKCCFSSNEGEQKSSWREAGPAASVIRHKV